MSRNAFLTEERLNKTPSVQRRDNGLQPGFPSVDAPQGREPGDRMTMRGVVTASGFLAALLMVGAVFGWGVVDAPGDTVVFPGWIMGAMVGGFVLLGLAYFKPHLAKYIGPAYALVEGVVVGAVSHSYEVRFDGIVMQATLATIGIFAGMIAVYGTGLIKVTDKFRRGVMAATMAIMVMYMIQFVSGLLGSSFQIPFLHKGGFIGIGISLVIIVIASFNYLLDFDMIEKGIAAGAPKDREWVAALGLLWTTVWVYFEVLRLLSKLRD